jgi:hypothetical protein
MENNHIADASKKVRLIDANALLAEITAMKVIDPYKKMRGLGERWVRSEGYDILIQLVKHFPTVDAVEVVHGRWETANDGTHFCSNCGYDAPYTWDEIDRNFINSADDVPDRPSNYCPNCGAKMDGGKDDG